MTTGQSGDARQVIVAGRSHEITSEVQGELKDAAWVTAITGLPMQTFRALARQTVAPSMRASSRRERTVAGGKRLRTVGSAIRSH